MAVDNKSFEEWKKYGLRLGDCDKLSVYGGLERAKGSDALIAQLRECLVTLGFNCFLESGNEVEKGYFDENLERAIREFQFYASENYVARFNDSPSPADEEEILKDRYIEFLKGLGNSWDKPPQSGQHAYYLTPFEVKKKYNGPITGMISGNTADILKYWYKDKLRCPVMFELWSYKKVSGEPIKPVIVGGKPVDNVWTLKRYSKEGFPYANDKNYRGTKALYLRDIRYDKNKIISFAEFKGNKDKMGLLRGIANQRARLPVVPLEELSSDSQKSTFKVIRAISQLECAGFLDNQNSYDDSILSIGYYHWTALAEMPALLAFAATRSEELRSEIAKLGIRPQGAWSDKFENPTGRALYSKSIAKYDSFLNISSASEESELNEAIFHTLPGQVVNDKTKYHKKFGLLRDPRWHLRFIRLAYNEEFKKAMYDFARIRIRDILGTPWPNPSGDESIPQKVGDVFRSEYTVAHIVRMHIYRPAYVVSSGKANNKLVAAYTAANYKFKDPIDVSKEEELINKYKEQIDASDATAWSKSHINKLNNWQSILSNTRYKFEEWKNYYDKIIDNVALKKDVKFELYKENLPEGPYEEEGSIDDYKATLIELGFYSAETETSIEHAIKSFQFFTAGTHIAAMPKSGDLKLVENPLPYTMSIDGSEGGVTGRIMNAWKTGNGSNKYYRCPVKVFYGPSKEVNKTILENNCWRIKNVPDERFIFAEEIGEESSDVKLFGKKIGDNFISTSSEYCDLEWIPKNFFDVEEAPKEVTSTFLVLRSVMDLLCGGYIDGVSYDEKAGRLRLAALTTKNLSKNSIRNGGFYAFLCFMYHQTPKAYQDIMSNLILPQKYWDEPSTIKDKDKYIKLDCFPDGSKLINKKYGLFDAKLTRNISFLEDSLPWIYKIKKALCENEWLRNCLWNFTRMQLLLLSCKKFGKIIEKANIEKNTAFLNVFCSELSQAMIFYWYSVAPDNILDVSGNKASGTLIEAIENCVKEPPSPPPEEKTITIPWYKNKDNQKKLCNELIKIAPDGIIKEGLTFLKGWKIPSTEKISENAAFDTKDKLNIEDDSNEFGDLITNPDFIPYFKELPPNFEKTLSSTGLRAQIWSYPEEGVPGIYAVESCYDESSEKYTIDKLILCYLDGDKEEGCLLDLSEPIKVKNKPLPKSISEILNITKNNKIKQNSEEIETYECSRPIFENGTSSIEFAVDLGSLCEDKFNLEGFFSLSFCEENKKPTNGWAGKMVMNLEIETGFTVAPICWSFGFGGNDQSEYPTTFKNSQIKSLTSGQSENFDKTFIFEANTNDELLAGLPLSISNVKLTLKAIIKEGQSPKFEVEIKPNNDKFNASIPLGSPLATLDISTGINLIKITPDGLKIFENGSVSDGASINFNLFSLSPDTGSIIGIPTHNDNSTKTPLFKISPPSPSASNDAITSNDLPFISFDSNSLLSLRSDFLKKFTDCNISNSCLGPLSGLGLNLESKASVFFEEGKDLLGFRIENNNALLDLSLLLAIDFAGSGKSDAARLNGKLSFLIGEYSGEGQELKNGFVQIATGAFQIYESKGYFILEKEKITKITGIMQLEIPSDTRMEFNLDPNNLMISYKPTDGVAAISVCIPEETRGIRFECDLFVLRTSGVDFRALITEQRVNLGVKQLNGLKVDKPKIDSRDDLENAPFTCGELGFRNSKLVYGKLKASTGLTFFDDSEMNASIQLEQKNNRIKVVGVVEIIDKIYFKVKSLGFTACVNHLIISLSYTSGKNQPWDFDGEFSGSILFSSSKLEGCTKGALDKLFGGIECVLERVSLRKLGCEEITLIPQVPVNFDFANIATGIINGLAFKKVEKGEYKLDLLCDLTLQKIAGVITSVTFYGINIFAKKFEFPQITIDRIGLSLSMGGGVKAEGELHWINDGEEVGFAGKMLLESDVLPRSLGLVKLTRIKDGGREVPSLVIYFQTGIESQIFSNVWLRDLGVGVGINQALRGFEAKPDSSTQEHVLALVDNPAGLPAPNQVKSWRPFLLNGKSTFMLVGYGSFTYTRNEKEPRGFHPIIGTIILAVDQEFNITIASNLWIFTKLNNISKSEFLQNPLMRGAMRLALKEKRLTLAAKTTKGKAPASDAAITFLQEALEAVELSVFLDIDYEKFLLSIGWPWEAKYPINLGILTGEFVGGFRFGVYRGSMVFGLNLGVIITMGFQSEIGFNTRFGGVGARFAVNGKADCRASLEGAIDGSLNQYLYGNIRVYGTVGVHVSAYAKFKKKICGIKISFTISFGASLSITISANFETAFKNLDMGFCGHVAVAVSVCGYGIRGMLPVAYKSDLVKEVKNTIDSRFPPMPVITKIESKPIKPSKSITEVSKKNLSYNLDVVWKYRYAIDIRT